MISREILKKIRQIELRTNRIVTETLAGFSFQPSPQFGGVLIFLPDGHDFHQMFFFKNGKVNRIWPADDFCLVSGRRSFSVAKRVRNYLPKIIVKHHGEASANSRLARFSSRTSASMMRPNLIFSRHIGQTFQPAKFPTECRVRDAPARRQHDVPVRRFVRA